jgi:hypothetical protein
LPRLLELERCLQYPEHGWTFALELNFNDPPRFRLDQDDPIAIVRTQ